MNDTAGATAARDAIDAALNTTTADLVEVISGGTVNNFGVLDSASRTVRGVSYFIAKLSVFTSRMMRAA